MQNLQNKYCEPIIYVAKHYVTVMTTTVKLASFVEIYFLGWIFQTYRGEYIFADKQRFYIWHEFISRLSAFSKYFGSKIKCAKYETNWNKLRN